MRTSEQASTHPPMTESIGGHDTECNQAKDKGGKDYKPKNFPQVSWQEIETIRKRRHAFNILSKPEMEMGPAKAPADLFGVSLSGGGIRSASFCLGALQALDQYGLLCRADYLSTVSGGGYIAASMAASMNTLTAKQDSKQPVDTANLRGGDEKQNEEQLTRKWLFPFVVGADSDVSDTNLVGHIRDNSKFLAPRGLYDVGISAAVLMRGLAVNFLLLLAVLLPLATVVIVANPTTEHLKHSVLLDLARRFAPESWSSFFFLADPFILSKATAILLIYWLIGWAIWRSHKESVGLRNARKRPIEGAKPAQGEARPPFESASNDSKETPPNTNPGPEQRGDYGKPERSAPTLEQSGIGAKLGRVLLILLIVAFVVELQPRIVNGIIDWMAARESESRSTIITLATTAGSIIAFTAAFQAKLVAWIEHAMSSSKWGAWLQAVLARAAFYALGLALPLVVYGLFLALVVLGIKLCSAQGEHYPYSPSFLVASDWQLAILLGITLGILLLLWLGSIARLHYGRLGKMWTKLGEHKFSSGIVLTLLIAPVILLLSAHATRAQSTEQEWIVLTNYILLTAIVLVIAVNFTENANGLHRLYRDRLRTTFQLGHFALHELGEQCPYLLINGTLNVRRPGKAKAAQALAQPQATALDRVSADPAKRGRNAEFFLLSRHFIGSDATGYAPTQEVNRQQPELDLAAAVAISGAAVSSSMGRIGIGLLGPTLALLNLRLGYWLLNPSKLDPDQRGWEDIFRRYLFDEAFGRLHSRSPRIYITDGGHIDNIGLYQLLKRRCRLIIVIDAEADPGMNFSAFADVQRFARIDEGVRISLDWRPMREATLLRLADRTKTSAKDAHKLHFATGHILYKDGSKGILLYVKATVTGDEPDYILDYERRHPTFPHESTNDQFFSEEQMEAYRALGFHAMRVALDEPPAIHGGTDDAEAERDNLVQEFKRSCQSAPSAAG